jgi:hypothetical protein
MAENPSSNSVEQTAHLSWPLTGLMCFRLALLDIIYSTKSGNEAKQVQGMFVGKFFVVHIIGLRIK